MMLKSLIVAAVFAAHIGSAHATNFAIGSLPLAPATYSNVQSVPSGAFSDLYSFVFPAAAVTGSGSAVSISVASILNISGMQLSLLDAGQVTLASGGFGDASTLFNQTLTAGGSYFFKLTGNATGSAGGTYAFLASASPVPEPGTTALLLAGLGVVSLIVHRRRQA